MGWCEGRHICEDFSKCLVSHEVITNAHLLTFSCPSFLLLHYSRAVCTVDSVFQERRKYVMFILKSTDTHRVPSVGIRHTP